MKASQWSTLELQKLRLLAGTMSIGDSVRFFSGRSRGAIIQKVHDLGLSWRNLRGGKSLRQVAQELAVSTERVRAILSGIGVTPQRYGEGQKPRYAFTRDEISRIEAALFDLDHPEFELYYCRQCGRETMKRWGWRWTTDARECGKRPLCHRCRVVARTTNRRPESYLLGSATRRARRAVHEVERALGGA